MKMQFSNNQEDLRIEKVGIGYKDVYRELEYLQPYVDKSKFVDMGLPSGRLWAKCNIDLTQQDKFAQSEYSYDASFFSWGNIDGHNPTGGTFDYNFSRENYNQTDGYAMYSQLAYGDEMWPRQDAAHANLNAPWRIPSFADWMELYNNADFVDANGDVIPESTTNKLITMNGIVGFRLKSKINGNYLFFASCGYGDGTAITQFENFASYWLTTIGMTGATLRPHVISITSTSSAGDKVTTERYGNPIRPVI